MAHNSVSLQAAFKYLFIDEIPALKELAQSLPSNPIVINIGAGSGTSGLAFMESRPDLFLYTIDRVGGDSPLGCLFAEEQVLQEAGLWQYERVRHVLGNSSLVGSIWLKIEQFDKHGFSLWPTPYCDLVFIDGDHSYEGCRGDIEAWLPNLKPGGILAVHDYKKHLLTYNEETCPHPRPWPGVDRAVDELLLGKYPVVMHVQSLIAFRVNE